MGAQVYQVEAAGASCVDDGGGGSKREIEKNRTKCGSTIFWNEMKKRTHRQLSGRWDRQKLDYCTHKHTSGSCPTAATNNESVNRRTEEKWNETSAEQKASTTDKNEEKRFRATYKMEIGEGKTREENIRRKKGKKKNAEASQRARRKSKYRFVVYAMV